MSNLIVPTILDNATLNIIKADFKDPLFGVALPMITGGLAFLSMKYAIKADGMGIGNSSWNIATTCLGIGVGYYFWNEKLTNVKLVGVGLGIAGLFLMNHSKYVEHIFN
jgi:multidrug transporter EmrE-like cation transporter